MDNKDSKKDNPNGKKRQVVISTVVKLPEETIKILKEKHGKDLHKCLLPLDEIGNKELEVALLTPSRRVMGFFYKYVDKDLIKAQDILVKNCVLTDKERILNDDNLFYSAANAIIQLIPIREARLGKF